MRLKEPMIGPGARFDSRTRLGHIPAVEGKLRPEPPVRAAFQEALLYAPGGGIAAGTDEISKNIIAERVLGLPQDVRVGRDRPFDELPTRRAEVGAQEASMDARILLLMQGAGVHAAAASGARNPTLADRTLGGLTDAQLRLRPAPNTNSIAWLLWHMARAEDAFLNIVLSGRGQLLDQEWRRRLGTDRLEIGTAASAPSPSPPRG